MNKKLPLLLILPCLLLGSIDAWSQAQMDPAEPDVALAKLWWPEQYNVWTPVGWPDHYFKFNVLYNGGLVILPATGSPNSLNFVGNDMQMMFCASADGHSWPMPQADLAFLREWDGGLGVQHWKPGHATPILETEYRNRDGMVMTTGMFAHMEGGGKVETALEPLYAWIRVSVKHVDGYEHPDNYKMSVMLSRLFMFHGDFEKLAPDIGVRPAGAPGLGTLSLVQEGKGYLVTNAEGKVRMAVYPSGGEEVTLTAEKEGLYNLCLGFKSEEGRYVDLLVPVLTCEKDVFEKEAALGYERALAEADRYWESRKPESAAVFDVPEPFLNEAVKMNLDFVPVIASKDYLNHEYCYISGTWGYDLLWSTPASFVGVMMDYLGYGDDVAKYDAVFAHTQGTAVAPGAAYKQHPGYLATPRHLKSIDWLTDHGAILWQVAMHGLLSGDEKFIAEWTEPIVKACDFIMEYSRSEHEGVPGLLPAATATDEGVSIQAVWILAWNYRGMYDAVRLLKKINHPRAGEFEAFLKEYKETFVREYRKVVESGPTWTDSAGRKRFRPSTTMSNVRSSFFHAFYLDGGPMVLVWAGLMDADDPIMRDLVDYFREGPNWELRKPFPWSCDRPVLEHEISSCEPCYSWNAFHSWQLGDRSHFLEAMYSVLVGAISQNTYISCEHRHGMQGTQFAFPFGFMLARLAVIDDLISEGDLHLLRLCPLAWLKSDYKTRFLRMPTEFGPVDLEMQLSADGKTLDVTYSLSKASNSIQTAPGEVVLHIPPVDGLKYVSVNGKRHPVRNGEIHL